MEMRDFLARPLSDALSRLEACRAAVETLLNAPFGSIVLYDLARLPRLRDALEK